ncbi:MAG: hypothetical protein ABUS54_12425 [Actinomycetota bacterium]
MVPSELAQLLADAEACANECEAFLATSGADPVVAAAAACRVLGELLDLHPDLFVAAVRVCRELATAAVEDAPALEPALLRVAESASAFLDAGR